ncbi:MAG: acetamidase/formamidase family protein [Candidatus Tectomicrobia bacterium]|uniref:Acetamidase/formamidase family protein n=1 Tax=Tectimicrobiota bacterium TaxID=2528274 RepID=A0A932I025_UNCTE|nr:acetamidase/formamidase family protein [Candidatus Tectomicrobia bacterium]
MAIHELITRPDNVHWGFYSAALKPVLSIDPGDTLVIHTESGRKDLLQKMAGRISPALKTILETQAPAGGAHIMTGPVAIRGARPGDVLEVRFRDIQPRYDWGYNGFRPLVGGLPEDFPYVHLSIVEVDKGSWTGDWGAGVKVPLSPFFGNFGVAPPAQLGVIPTSPPGAWGGNTDNKEFGAGSIVYLPVFNEEALFSAGDGHGCQGDGEANINGIEMGLTGTIEFILRKDLKLALPRAETATHWILMGFDPILDNAAKTALRETIKFLGEWKGMSRDDAYTLCSLAVDLRVTQIVNGVKGVHAMLPKALFE